MNQTKEMTLCAFFAMLFILASKIMIPIGIIPLTLQTTVVFLAGSLLKTKHILISYSIFFIMGLVGLPVFAKGGGIAYVLQPSFGFLLSFPIAACFISIIRQKWNLQRITQLYPICLLALLIIYAIGCLYMYGILNYYMGVHKNFSTVISIGALPFVFSDSISAAIGCICALRLIHIPVIKRAIA